MGLDAPDVDESGGGMVLGSRRLRALEAEQLLADERVHFRVMLFSTACSQARVLLEETIGELFPRIFRNSRSLGERVRRAQEERVVSAKPEVASGMLAILRHGDKPGHQLTLADANDVVWSVVRLLQRLCHLRGIVKQ